LLPSTDPYQVKTNSDIIISQSFDGGLTWSIPTAITQPNDQFEPWGAYDAKGRLQIGYYDRSYDPANHKYGYTLASETAPGSLHFTLQQVTTALSDPTQGDAWFTVTANANFPNATRFLGDYSNIAITPNGVAAFWTDMRLPSTTPGFPGSGEDAFFALVDPLAPPAAATSQPVPGVGAATVNPASATMILFPQTAPASAGPGALTQHSPAGLTNAGSVVSADGVASETRPHETAPPLAIPSKVAYLGAAALAEQITDSLFGAVAGDMLWAWDS
jgi:hypothetical protein